MRKIMNYDEMDLFGEQITNAPQIANRLNTIFENLYSPIMVGLDNSK